MSEKRAREIYGARHGPTSEYFDASEHVYERPPETFWVLGTEPQEEKLGSGGRASGKTFEGSGAKPLEKIKNPRRAISPNCPAWTPARRAPGGKKNAGRGIFLASQQYGAFDGGYS